MKIILALITTVALIAGPNAIAQDATTQSEVNQPIEEPSGTESVPAAPPTPPSPDFGAAPATPVNPAAAAAQTNSTITVSQTFTNDPNVITIVGNVATEQEKQAAEMKLQEALPGKQINNHLTVGPQQGIVEPAGAERKEGEQLDDAENELDDAQSDIPLNPEQKDQN